MPLIPAGSTTASRQTLIDANPTSTSFCLEAGSHSANGSNKPKSGSTFIGRYGATIDGTGWVTGDATQAAIRAHNEDVDNITIKNIRFANMPQYGVRFYVDFSSGLTVENCEFDHCTFGIEVCHNSNIRRCYFHHSATAAYTGNTPHDVLFEDNLFEDTLAEPNQKLVEGYNHIWRRNIFRRQYNGIWEDGDNHDVTIEDNVFEDCSGASIFYEISADAVIQRNTIRRSGTHGILISTSKGVTVTDNECIDCFRGIWMQVNLDIVGGGALSWDLANNTADGNIVRLTAPYASGAYNCGIDYSGAGSGTPYIDGSKNLVFSDNDHFVPDSGSYWFNAASKTWAQWQALPQDATGSRTIVP